MQLPADILVAILKKASFPILWVPQLHPFLNAAERQWVARQLAGAGA